MYDYMTISGEPAVHATLIGYQLRHIEGVGPKYLTALKDDNVKPFTQIGPHISGYCVLVEDLASGLALTCVAVDHGLSILVNYGVQIKPEALYSMTNCGTGVVWLDNDGPHITKKAQDIARTWALISGKPVIVEHEHHDPKQYTWDELSDIIGGWDSK
jgi:hypothetical protein